MGSMEGKVVLVTGASRGIGASIAQRFAAEGAAVAVTARTRAEGDHPLPGSLEATVASIQAAGGRALPLVADLAKAAERSELVEQVERTLGPIDVLVNNAAITWFGPVDAFREDHWRLMFEVQVRAPFELAQRVLPGMRKKGRGWILNISSAAAMHPKGPPYRRGLAGGTVYGMCKAALERFTTGLAAEVHADGIAVNVLSPAGLVLTPGAVHHELDRLIPKEHHEPMEVMVAAAHALCTGDPAQLTGRVAYATPLVRELGVE